MATRAPEPCARKSGRGLAFAAGLALLSSGTGCLGLTPQLHPADVAALEHVESREAREAAYERERIRAEFDPRGKRFTKGGDPNAPKRGWQSLDAVLRSDANSAAALPHKKLRTSRILMGISMVGGLVMIAGASATAREALNLGRVTGPGLILVGGSAMSLGFGIGAGVTFGQARKGYEGAVDVYNESLGLRLGLYDENGSFIPPGGTVLDEDGFMILRDEQPVAAADRSAAESSEGPDSGLAAGPAANPAGNSPNAHEAPLSRPAITLEHRGLTAAPAR